jgi:hypothetical protein
MTYTGCDARGRIFEEKAIDKELEYGSFLQDNRLDLCNDCFKVISKAVNEAIETQRKKYNK